MMKKISLIALSFVVMLGLSGCKVPFTDKEISLPFGDKNPEAVMDNVYSKMSEMKTSEFEGLYEIGFKIDPSALEGEKDDDMPTTPGMPDFSGPIDMAMIMGIVGKSDMNDKENLKTNGQAKLSFDMSGMEFKLDYDMVMIGEDMYIKINKLPLPFAMMLGNNFVEKWWHFDMKEMQEMQEELAAQTGEEIEMTMYDIQDSQEKMMKIQSRIYEIAKKNKMLLIDEEMDDEEIDGEKHYHYKVSLNEDTLDEVAKEVIDIVKVEFGNELEGALDEIDEKMMNDVVTQIANVITLADGEIWINKKTFFITKSKINLALDMSKLDASKIDDEDFEPIPEGAFEISVKGETLYKNINQPVDIKAPEGSDSFVDFMRQMMEQAAMTGAVTGGEANTDYESMYGDMNYDDINMDDYESMYGDIDLQGMEELDETMKSLEGSR